MFNFTTFSPEVRFRGVAPEVGRQAPTSRRLALGFCTLGAQTGISCYVVSHSGPWGPACRGHMRSFKCVLLLFSLIFLLEHDWLALTLKFLIDKKFELRRESVFENNRKMDFL